MSAQTSPGQKGLTAVIKWSIEGLLTPPQTWACWGGQNPHSPPCFVKFTNSCSDWENGGPAGGPQIPRNRGPAGPRGARILGIWEFPEFPYFPNLSRNSRIRDGNSRIRDGNSRIWATRAPDPGNPGILGPGAQIWESWESWDLGAQIRESWESWDLGARSGNPVRMTAGTCGR